METGFNVCHKQGIKQMEESTQLSYQKMIGMEKLCPSTYKGKLFLIFVQMDA